MRYLSPLLLLVLAAPAFGQRPALVPRVYVPPPWTLPGTVGAISVYPDPSRGYYGTARFFGVFWKEVAREYGRMGEEPEPEPLPPPDPRSDPSRARVTLHVPETAEVWVENEKLSALGSTREVLSTPLDAGVEYKYSISVRWVEGNKPREQRFSVPVRAGDTPVLMVLGR